MAPLLVGSAGGGSLRKDMRPKRVGQFGGSCDGLKFAPIIRGLDLCMGVGWA